MIHTSVFTLNTNAYQWEVAHLFEHLVIDGFYKVVEKHGYNPALMGWIDANTFPDRIYIETGFYDSAVARLFESYMNNIPGFTEAEIKAGLMIIEAEGRTVFYAYESHMKKDLIKLSRLKWNSEQEGSGKVSATPLKGTRSSAKFRDVTIGIYAEGLTEEEEKVILRFWVLINDYVVHIIRTQLHGYSRGCTPVQKDDRLMGALMVITFARNGMTLKQLKNFVEESFDTFRTELNMDEVDKHFSVYAATPLWKSLAVFYYRWTGINTTTEEIASLATEANVKSLLSKIRFVVRPAVEYDYKNL